MTRPLTMEQALGQAAAKTKSAIVRGYGMHETKDRATASKLGSERLCDAIEDLVIRTAKRLDIPAEHKARPLTFARAYLGMETRA